MAGGELGVLVEEHWLEGARAWLARLARGPCTAAAALGPAAAAIATAAYTAATATTATKHRRVLITITDEHQGVGMRMMGITMGSLSFMGSLMFMLHLLHSGRRRAAVASLE